MSALPTLIKMASVVRGSHQEWNGIAELPLEVPLPSGMRYHSMFTCPITKEPRYRFIHLSVVNQNIAHTRGTIFNARAIYIHRRKSPPRSSSRATCGRIRRGDLTEGHHSYGQTRYRFVSITCAINGVSLLHLALK